ncbi:hypothetical protein LTR49_021486 [Elasticomyces elasticus]|nr:hypothetical protein LTR49_021486 [Elasticomyces elasticus]KAK5738645.1 hypothetical protein LTS12_025507 [Elasticomyces elasticus]
MAITPPILTLPVELLQQVFSDYDNAGSAEESSTSHSLLSLRLVCKEFNVATFDQVATKYFRIWECCLMLPSHVDKLIKFLDTEAISQELRTVRLRMAPYKEMSDYDTKCPPAKPDGARLGCLLSRIKENCMLDLELGQHSKHPNIIEWNLETLKAVERAGCQIQRLCLAEHAIPATGFPIHLKALTQLRELHCDFTLSGMTRAGIDSFYSLQKITACASQLEYLRLSMGDYKRGKRASNGDDLATTILLSCSANTLSKLTLWDLHAEPETLVQGLHKFQGTLHDITLYGVVLLSAQESWSKVLRVAQNMPKLKSLYLGFCMQAANGDQWRVLWKNCPNNMRGSDFQFDRPEAGTVREKIDFALKRGLRFSEAF